METEDLIKLPASSHSDSGENVNLPDPNCGVCEAESVPRQFEVKEDKFHEEILENSIGGTGIKGSHLLGEADNGVDVVESTSMLHVTVEVTEDLPETEMVDCVNPTVLAKNDHLTVQDGSSFSNDKTDAISGVKRPRITVEGQQTSVHVIYSSLTRDSKQKLEELLQQWSEWHAQHGSSSYDSNEVLESGEETYFPALKVGLNKPSAVSFWVDDQAQNLQYKEFVPLDGKSVPLYDRGYSLALTSADGSNNVEGGLEIVNAPRCFNCGSYSHSLKECPKPRDIVAVNNARKQHKSKRNHNASLRNSSRYYQNSPGGKFDGLRPGVLDAETRKLLGLRELDPPPWLNRMREIGYPPGYLDPEDDNQPSGIMIFADGESKEETEEGEILDTTCPEPSRKMSVEFPGINAPIPENADERRWAAVSSSIDPSRSRSYDRFDPLSEHTSREHFRKKRCTYDFRDDGPPGVDPRTYRQRYGLYDSSFTSYSSRGNISVPKSPIYGRPLSNRGWRSPFSP